MSLHKIATYHGTKPGPNGTTIHVYKAICGIPIYALHVFKQGQQVTLGNGPHAGCVRCFATEKDPMGETTRMPFGEELGQEVYDETGRRAVTSRDDSGLGRDTEGQGLYAFRTRKIESNDPTAGRPFDDNGLGPVQHG